MDNHSTGAWFWKMKPRLTAELESERFPSFLRLFAKRVQRDANGRGEPTCCSIKTFIDVTHKTLLFYYLDGKVVISLTALLLWVCGVLRAGFSLARTRKNQSSDEGVFLLFSSFYIPSFCISSLLFPPSVLTRLRFLARVWFVKSHCMFRGRSG